MFEEEPKIENYEETIQDLEKRIGISIDAHFASYKENPKLFIENLQPDDIEIYRKFLDLVDLYNEKLEPYFKRDNLKKEFTDLEKKIDQMIPLLEQKTQDIEKQFSSYNKMQALGKRYPNKKNQEFREEYQKIYSEFLKERDEKKYNPAYCRIKLIAYLKGKVRPYINFLKGNLFSEK